MSKKNFIESIDYYLENGMVIMTEKYLIDKGPCCGNKCRHCPYEPIYQRGSTKVREDIEKKDK